MTYDKNNETSSPQGNAEHSHGPFSDRWSHHAGTRSTWNGPSWASRPGFHPMKAIIVLGGFAIFPPLGVLALGYFLWNSRSSFGRGGEQFAGNSTMGRGCGRGSNRRGPFTGNAAFDEHQAATINKLREERRAFFEFRNAERQKRDQVAYEAFRNAQDKPTDEQPDDSVAKA